MHEHHHETLIWRMNELAFEIVAKTGITTDRYHLGKLILHCLRNAPEFVSQIDGGTGESETSKSVLKRSIQCAEGMKQLGIKTGDGVVFMAPNHLDLAIPFYACLYIGAMVVPADRFSTLRELEDAFNVTTPKLIFCHKEKIADIQTTLTNCGLDAKIISFDYNDDGLYFDKFLDLAKNVDEDTFEASDFDPEETISVLMPTSGTTGLPKYVAAPHKSFALMSPYFYYRSVKVPPMDSFLLVTPMQWLSAPLHMLLSVIFKFTRIQTSLPTTREHVYELINKYKPKSMLVNPTTLASLLQPGERDKCDFTCFELITVGGNALIPALLDELKSLSPNTVATNYYGMTELTCTSFVHCFDSPPASVGKPMACLQYRLVDENGKDIKEPNVNGELWLKGPGFFKGYYRNPEATKEVFSEDGWYKSGDLLYRDEHWNFYFVERLKLLLKYKGYHISPYELEVVIRQHPGVLDVVVTSYPDKEDGDLLVACVVPKQGQEPTAQEIKDIVKENLSDSKQLRGGVVFLNELPVMPSLKVHRRKLKEMVLTMKRE